MSAPTSQQKTDLHTMTAEGSSQSNGAFLGFAAPQQDDPFYEALTIACNLSNFQIGLGDGIDLYTGFLILNDLNGGTLVPDSSSSVPLLAFVGRVRELYASLI